MGIRRWLWLACIGATIVASCSDRVVEAARVTNRTVRLPRVGARVRVIVPNLGPGWRVGVFRQTPEHPPCFLVVLFNPARERTPAATIYAGAVARMQVSTLFGGDSAVDNDPGAAAYEGEDWIDASLDSAQHTGRTCPTHVDRAG